jgi:uncharacterized protein GlcG (DUF336 family)
MDGAPGSASGAARAKAYVAAVTQDPSTNFQKRMHAAPEKYLAYDKLLDDKLFPGPGGLPIYRDGRVIGAISTGPGIGQFKVDEHTYAEDVVIAHALGIPYKSQHDGDDDPWMHAVESASEAPTGYKQ